MNVISFIAEFLATSTAVFGILTISGSFWLSRPLRRRLKADQAAIARLERELAEPLEDYVSRCVRWTLPEPK